MKWKIKYNTKLIKIIIGIDPGRVVVFLILNIMK